MKKSLALLLLFARPLLLLVLLVLLVLLLLLVLVTRLVVAVAEVTPFCGYSLASLVL